MFNTYVTITLHPKKYVNHNCAVQNFTLQKKQHPLRVQTVLFIMPANPVCKRMTEQFHMWHGRWQNSSLLQGHIYLPPLLTVAVTLMTTTCHTWEVHCLRKLNSHRYPYSTFKPILASWKTSHFLVENTLT
jgi:hypothetical protein